MPTASIFTGKSNHGTFRVIKSPVVNTYDCLRKYSHMRLHHCMSNNIDSDTCNLAVAGVNCSEPRNLYWTHLRSAWLSLGSLFGQCQMMRYYLPIAFGRIGVSYNDITDFIVPAAVRRCVVAWIRCVPLRRCNAFDFCVLHLRRLQHLYR